MDIRLKVHLCFSLNIYVLFIIQSADQFFFRGNSLNAIFSHRHRLPILKDAMRVELHIRVLKTLILQCVLRNV